MPDRMYHPAPAPDEGDVFGPLGHWLMFALRAPLRHKRVTLAVLLGVGLLGAAIGQTLPLKYEVQTVVLAQRDPLLAALSTPGAAREWDFPTRAAREMLLRRDNLLALLQETNFAERYLQTRAPAARLRDWVTGKLLRRIRTPAMLQDDLASALEQRLWVTVSMEGQVTIGFTWSDPELALDLVKVALHSFLEARHAAEIGALGGAIAILESHQVRLQNEIGVAITKLQQKQRALSLSTSRGVVAPRPAAKVDDELVRLQGELSARRRALADLEEYRQRRTAELQAQLAQQLTVFAPAHPTVQATRAAIAGLSVPSPQIGELQQAIAGLTADVAARGGRAEPAPRRSVEEGLAAELVRSSETRDPRLDYERRELETLLRRHTTLVDRIESSKIELDAAAKDFKQRYPVISPPKLPRAPLKPLGLFFAAGGFLLGAFVACAVATVIDLRSGRIVEQWQIEHVLELPIVTDLRR